MESQAVPSNVPSPLSKLGSTSSSSRRAKSPKDEKKEEKKKKKEEKKREGSRRKPNKRGSTRQPGKTYSGAKEVFGVSLEELMQRQRLDHPHLQVPIVLLNCAHAIILLEGHKKEGIFRYSCLFKWTSSRNASSGSHRDAYAGYRAMHTIWRPSRRQYESRSTLMTSSTHTTLRRS
jgi:hypothetical protein